MSWLSRHTRSVGKERELRGSSCDGRDVSSHGLGFQEIPCFRDGTRVGATTLHCRPSSAAPLREPRLALPFCSTARDPAR